MAATVMAPITKDTPHPFHSLWEITEAARIADNGYFDIMGSHGFQVSGVVYPVRGGALFVVSNITPDGRRLYSVRLALRETITAPFTIDFLDGYDDYASRSGAHAAAKHEQARRT
jgi:hypothetical protein